MLSPMPLYEYTRLARIFEAAATEMRRLCRSSWRRHCMPRYASQYWQSCIATGCQCFVYSGERGSPTAAPPAIVPRRQLLISMTFLTVWLAIQFPCVALESVATIMPPLNLKARVVVPCAILMGQFGLEWSSVIARSHDDGCEGSRSAKSY